MFTMATHSKNIFFIVMFCTGVMWVSQTKTMETKELEKSRLDSKSVEKGKGRIAVVEKPVEEVKTIEDLRDQLIIDVIYYVIEKEKFIDVRELFDKVEKERGYENGESGANLIQFSKDEFIFRSYLEDIPNNLRCLVKVSDDFGREMQLVSISLPKK